MHLISIIIPTHDRKKLLIHSIESCLEQSYSNIEIIVIDDGSTDGTDAWIKQRLNEEWKNAPIIYYKQSKSGASAARNKGIELSKGKYIQFLDSDDLLHSEKLKLQLECIENYRDRYPVGCSCYGLLGESFENAKGVRIGIKCHSPHEYIEKLCSRIVHGMQTSAPLWESSFIKSQQGWRNDISLGDDLEYHIRLLTTASYISFVEKELFLVREHEDERLSIVKLDTSKITSSILTKKIIFETIQKANLWNIQIQKTFLRSLQTTYANVLTFCSKDQIVDFENFLKKLSYKPRYCFLYPILITIRTILGKKFIVNTHKVFIKIRETI